MLSQRVKRERKLKKKNIDILYYVKLYLGYASFSHVLFPITSDYEKSLSNCGQFPTVGRDSSGFSHFVVSLDFGRTNWLNIIRTF